MKEMVYKYEKGQPAFVLNKGEYYGYEYLVISLGRHPCGYVCLTEDNKNFGKFYDDIHIECHGGLTFSEPKISFLEYSDKYKTMVRTGIHNKWIIGWDYAHYGDYTVWDRSGIKHSTQEITNECKYVIAQLIIQEYNDTIDRIIEKVDKNPTEENIALLEEVKENHEKIQNEIVKYMR